MMLLIMMGDMTAQTHQTSEVHPHHPDLSDELSHTVTYASCQVIVSLMLVANVSQYHGHLQG